MKIMASRPIISWQTDGETMETMTHFIFLCSQITADGDCSHEIKRCLLLGRKVMTNILKFRQHTKKQRLKFRQHTKKQRHYFANKGPFSQSYGFSSSHVWMWELDHKEDWAPKNWYFWTAVWEKTLERKEISPEYHWKDWCWSSNTLAIWCEGLTHWKKPWCSERLQAGREGGNRGWDGWMASPTQWTWVWAKLQKTVKDREAWHAAVCGVTKIWTWLRDWTNFLKIPLF